ncbi:uncharacterized protein LOC114540736 [Dendronephthya gigantea]|uniref:uncharacterized protein LOC114540736 n=1 Tax=Dendronephthya gigantea TaxID=151771 RepID=UPI00106CB6A3|nr:uncharacterized protein LOC114540736 [Dendronephthya gigantea]
MSSPCGFGFSSSPEPASPSTIETLREREIEGSSPIGIGFSSNHENTRSPQSAQSPVKRRRMLHCDTPSTCAQESSGQRKTKRSLNYEGDSEVSDDNECWFERKVVFVDVLKNCSEYDRLENRFTKCDHCTNYKKQLEATMNKAKRKAIQELLDEHIERVMNERRKYHLHRYKARRSPSKYLTIILDGMDQSKTDVPNLRRVCKSTANLQKLRTHLVGTIMHSGLCPMGKLFHGMFDLFQWKHDSNLTMNILIKLLALLNDRYGLPPILNLQVDNCWRENKNKYVLTLLSLLVEWSVFDKIKGNFLPVGHTHEDIDALFGCFSKHLKFLDVYTVNDIRKAFEECCNKPYPESDCLSCIYDIKKLLDGHSEDLHNHVKPHCFKFVRNEKNKAVMYYRKWSDDEWMGPISLLKSTPMDMPVQIPADFAKADLPKLAVDM